MNKQSMTWAGWLLIAVFLSLALSACGSSPAPAPTPVVIGGATPNPTGAYPAPGEASAANTPAAYPDAASPQEEILPAPPDPARDLPPASADSGVIGGALIRELSEEGFMPLDPHELILASIVTNDAGTPMFLRHDEDALRAETFPTGVFVFHDVPPGRYGLIVGIGITQFPVRTPDGAELLVDVTPGAVIDLGQVIVQFP